MVTEKTESYENIKSDEVRFGYIIYKEDESNEKFKIVDMSENSVMVKGIYSYEIEGNYYIPLYKKFKVEYVMDMSKLNEENPPWYTLEGKLEGTMEFEIKGICTIKKTKSIVERMCFKTVKNILMNLENQKWNKNTLMYSDQMVS